MAAHGSMNYQADEVRLDVELGQSFIADFHVKGCNLCTITDISAYTLEALISRPGVTNPSIAFQLTQTPTMISAGLTRANIETLYALSSVWNYQIWLVKVGFRGPAVRGPIVINTSMLQDG